MSDKSIQIAARRYRIGELYLDGLSHSKIAKQLAEEGYTGHKGQVLDRSSITKDLIAISEQWIAEIGDSVARHRANHLQMAQHLYRQSLLAGDLRLALETLKVMIRLLGTEMPQRHTVEGGDNPIVISVLPAGMWEHL